VLKTGGFTTVMSVSIFEETGIHTTRLTNVESIHFPRDASLDKPPDFILPLSFDNVSVFN
jgi:hypothetical protein